MKPKAQTWRRSMPKRWCNSCCRRCRGRGGQRNRSASRLVATRRGSRPARCGANIARIALPSNSNASAAGNRPSSTARRGARGVPGEPGTDRGRPAPGYRSAPAPVARGPGLPATAPALGWRSDVPAPAPRRPAAGRSRWRGRPLARNWPAAGRDASRRLPGTTPAPRSPPATAQRARAGPGRGRWPGPGAPEAVHRRCRRRRRVRPLPAQPGRPRACLRAEDHATPGRDPVGRVQTGEQNQPGRAEVVQQRRPERVGGEQADEEPQHGAGGGQCAAGRCPSPQLAQLPGRLLETRQRFGGDALGVQVDSHLHPGKTRRCRPGRRKRPQLYNNAR